MLYLHIFVTECSHDKYFLQLSKNDPVLARLLDEAREYACVHVLARQRQKGCDGMGELATIKEEVRDVIDKVIEYCKEKKYISEVMSYDVDSIADEIVKGQELL